MNFYSCNRIVNTKIFEEKLADLCDYATQDFHHEQSQIYSHRLNIRACLRLGNGRETFYNLYLFRHLCASTTLSVHWISSVSASS